MIYRNCISRGPGRARYNADGRLVCTLFQGTVRGEIAGWMQILMRGRFSVGMESERWSHGFLFSLKDFSYINWFNHVDL